VGERERERERKHLERSSHNIYIYVMGGETDDSDFRKNVM
jgi:hypothetical protein